ncbi:MAG: hypothetical protein IPL25_19255 [Saprospiraceae bacterium]|nr:hypothetical protein [Candidatus Vicinibacter affinis]
MADIKTIELPEGGIINIELESDEYAYMQDKPAMEMVKVIGIGDDINPFISTGQDLFNFGNSHLALKLKLPSAVFNRPEFQLKYLKDIGDNDTPMYFKFLIDLNNNDQYEYVEGFAVIDDYDVDVSDQTIAYIKLKHVPIGDNNLNLPSPIINPIAKAAWNFAEAIYQD